MPVSAAMAARPVPSARNRAVFAVRTIACAGSASRECLEPGKRGSDIYLLDVVRGRFEVPDLRRRIEATADAHGAPATLIEETDIGRAILQEMRLHSHVRPILWRVRLDKEARLLGQAPKFEAGQVLLPRDAPWLAEYVSELLAFPNGAHDDQVDSTSQALGWLSRRIAKGMPPVRPNPTRPAGAAQRRQEGVAPRR